jgi:hypothetical protein
MCVLSVDVVIVECEHIIQSCMSNDEKKHFSQNISIIQGYKIIIVLYKRTK